jgi:hypothetical protein
VNSGKAMGPRQVRCWLKISGPVRDHRVLVT